MGPHPAVAAVRLAVRRSLAGLLPGDVVLAACSGGADSLALAAGLAFEGPRLGLRAGGVTVDHGLHSGSAAQAGRASAVLAELGLEPVLSLRATVAAPGCPAAGGASYPGPEAAARVARYAALEQAGALAGAVAILLGHTLDDQAETVLLGLARGSGARSLAGMPPGRPSHHGAGRHGAGRHGAGRHGAGRHAVSYLRPLLDVRRAQTVSACAALGLQPWTDPHNSDPAYARVRVRTRLLPALEAELGPGVAEALARTARQLRADAEALDELAAAAAARIADGDPGLPADALAVLPEAIRSRILRSAALAAGTPAGTLGDRHIGQVDALITSWRGQRWVDLPGGVRCRRQYGRLLFAPALREGRDGRA